MPRYTDKQKLFASQVGGAGVLVGLKAVAAVFGVSTATIARWRKKHGLDPYITKLPGGEIVTTVFALDRWIADRSRKPLDRARDALEELSPKDRVALLLEATADLTNAG